ncbi:MAG TPA: inorganic diphosphatase [Terriglobales bacterium]|nr:inorganic diphosphatase [Terriglobales bacterium]
MTDHKIIAVEDGNPRYAEIKEVSDLYPHIPREIEHFFSVYKALEKNQTKIVGWADSSAARSIIKESIRSHIDSLHPEEITIAGTDDFTGLRRIH